MVRNINGIQTKLHANLVLKINSDIFNSRDILLGCDCSYFVDENGYGKCETKYKLPPYRSLVCYVDFPNSCSDFSPPLPGQWHMMSAVACQSLGKGKLH